MTTILTPDQTAELADMLRIMGDGNRLRIILACLEVERPVGELAAELGLSPSLASHHLRLLRAARILKARREGKHVYYTAADAHVHATAMLDGVMRMLPVDALELSGGATTPLTPGGLHIMLTGLHAPLIAGETFDLTLTFGQAGTIVIEVPVGDVAAMSRR